MLALNSLPFFFTSIKKKKGKLLSNIFSKDPGLKIQLLRSGERA